MLTLAIETVVCDDGFPGMLFAKRKQSRTETRELARCSLVGKERPLPDGGDDEDRAQLFLSQVVSINTTCQRA